MSTWREQTPHASRFIEAAVKEPRRTLVALDFDGTLAAIVPDPTDSRLHEGAAAALARLGERIRQLAIITGRGVGTVRELGRLEGRPGLSKLIVLGQYGVERWDAATGAETTPEIPVGILQARPEVERTIADCGYDGVVLEDKGRALGVHTRRSSDPEAAFEALRAPLTAIATSHGLVVEPGRNVLELRASLVTKGDALRDLVRETGATVVAFVGDDLGDLPAFEVLAQLRDQGLTTCAVVSGSDEQPDVAARADVLADGPDGVAEWLDALADAIDDN